MGAPGPQISSDGPRKSLDFEIGVRDRLGTLRVSRSKRLFSIYKAEPPRLGRRGLGRDRPQRSPRTARRAFRDFETDLRRCLAPRAPSFVSNPSQNSECPPHPPPPRPPLSPSPGVGGGRGRQEGEGRWEATSIYTCGHPKSTKPKAKPPRKFDIPA